MNSRLTPFAATAVLALTLGAFPAKARSSPTQWYISHWDADSCVPLDDVPDIAPGPGSTARMYYGSGPYHTPNDLVNALEGLGTTVDVTAPAPSTVELQAHSFFMTIKFILFDDLPACRLYMRSVAP